MFQAVTEEVGRLIPAEAAALTRFETDGTTVTALGGWARGGYDYVGTRFALEGTVSGLVLEICRSGRIDDYAEKLGPAAAADVAAEIADLHRGAGRRFPEQLVLLADRHQEPQRAVGPEHRVMPLLRANDRLRNGTRFRQIEQIERVDALVLIPVGRREREHCITAVARDFGRAESVHRLHVGRGHRPGGQRGGRERSGGGEEEHWLDHVAGVAKPRRRARTRAAAR